MPTTSRPYRPDQMLLLAPDLHQWLDEGHLACHVSDLVDALGLGAFYARYEGDGRRNSPYEPSMMWKVLVYAYATGGVSSRSVARKLEEDVAFGCWVQGTFRSIACCASFAAVISRSSRGCSSRGFGWRARWAGSASGRCRWMGRRCGHLRASARR